MFSKAYEIVSNYTFPVIILSRHFDKTIQGGLGTFVIINEDGWFVTAAHIFNIQFEHDVHQKELDKYNSELSSIDNDTSLNVKAKAKRKSKITFNNKWILNHSFWWGMDGLECEQFYILKENDLAIGKLKGFNKEICKNYPIFKNQSSLKVATSLCKLGFPFHDVKATFDETKNMFQIGEGILPIPRFPIEGIYTRNVLGGKIQDLDINVMYMETSTPGLKGQSGGPTFDTDGNIWAIQSQTANIPLGFSPKANINGKEVIENQFLNVGYGIHVETICKFLDKHNVKYIISEDNKLNQ